MGSKYWNRYLRFWFTAALLRIATGDATHVSVAECTGYSVRYAPTTHPAFKRKNILHVLPHA